MARLSKQNWLDEGFKLLSEFAQDKLRIQYLCERLKVTRGSFYHHFTGIDNYVAELMEAWEQEHTLDFIRTANQGHSAEQRMELLSKRIGQASQSVEAAIRSWSFYQPIVKKHLTRVDEVRLNYIQQIFEEMGFDPTAATLRAQLDYATLIGVQQLFPNADEEQMKQLWAVQRQMVMSQFK